MTVRRVHSARVSGRIRAPSSKSYTHRALVAAFLADRPCHVRRPLDSDDTRATLYGLRGLGARVRRGRTQWSVAPASRKAPSSAGTVRCGESGTTLRLLSAVAALGSRPTRFEGSPSLAVRPMGELFADLVKLGAQVHSPPGGRSLPCTIQGPLRSGSISIRGDVSSQYTSALLMVLPTVAGDSRIRVLGRAVSEPFVQATCAVLQERGVRVYRNRNTFSIPGNQRYRDGIFRVPGDASSAAYLWAAAAVTGGSVEVAGIPSDRPQADLAILPILAEMGADVIRTSHSVRVTGSLTRPVSVDLTSSPDLYPLVSVLASLVPEGRSRLSGAPNLRFKESDRRAGSIRLARSLGAKVSDHSNRLEVRGTDSPRRLNLPSLSDHRLVMSAVVGALAASGSSRIGRAEAVSKSYPGFWDAVGALTAGQAVVP